MESKDAIRSKKILLKGIWWIGLLIILGVVGLVVYKNQKSNSGTEEKPTQNILPKNNYQTKEGINCPPVFDSEFTDFSKIDGFQPIGSITGASRGRSYITVKKGETVPVYAPTDAILIAVIYAFRGPDTDHGEYGFKFDTKCNTTFLLDHLDSVSDEMKKYAPNEPTRSTATEDNLSIPIKAGTLLGYTNGTTQARTFDFLVIDRNINVFHINPQRWEWDQSLYSVCPYDLFNEDLKAKYYQKIGVNTEAGFKKAKSCGNISYDIKNTISGGWFLNDKATDLKGEFLLIGTMLDQVDVVAKNDSEITNLRITDYNPKILPKDVGVGESVCYIGFTNDWVYLHLIDSLTLEVNNGSGKCPLSFPLTGAKKYFR